METDSKVLSYQSAPVRVPMRKPLRVVFLVLAIPSLALPFLNYVDHTSPLDASQECLQRILDHPPEWIWLLMLGLNFFMAIPLFAWRVRTLFGEPTRVEVWIGYWLAMLGLAPVAADLGYFWYAILKNPGSLSGVEAVSMPAGMILSTSVLFVGVWIVWRLGKRGLGSTRVTACLGIPYLANLLLCVFFFMPTRPDYPGVGYVVSLPIVAALAVEYAFFVLMAFRRVG